MGASSSIVGGFHIHISLSTKYIDEDRIISEIVSKLRNNGIRVTITDPDSTTKNICDTLKSANIVIYCNTQNYGTCSTQAIEYSYLSENDTLTYNVIIDRYKNSSYTNYMQGFLQGNGWELSSVDDIPKIIQDINRNVFVC